MLADWRPFFWEPVHGTGERLMAGAVLVLGGEVFAKRLIRDDVLHALYGSGSANPARLIDHALDLILQVCKTGGLQSLASMDHNIMGLWPGPLRRTEALDLADGLRQVVLLHSSLSQLDGLDVSEEESSIVPDEVNKRFATEVREVVIARRPELRRFFGQPGRLHEGGSLVRFGFLSSSAVLHFSVLHPVRQPASVNFARAKLWELARAKEHGQLSRAALITAFPRNDDPTLGKKQLAALVENKRGIELEADDANMRFIPVSSVAAAADEVLTFA